MKYLLFFVLFIGFNLNIGAQNIFPPERIVVVATIENGTAKATDYNLSDLGIESKIARIYRLEKSKLTLMNPSLIDEGGKGWYLQYEFETEGYIGLWKEQLRLRNGKFVITESRNAKIVLASNCNELKFTDDESHAKCTSKKDSSTFSEITYRVFGSSN